MPDPRLRALLVLVKAKHPNYSAIEAFDWATEILECIDNAERQFKQAGAMQNMNRITP